MVMVEVQSAVVVDGRVVLPGQVVQVPRSDAAALVARGKAVVVDAGRDADEAAGVVGEDGVPVLDEVVVPAGAGGAVEDAADDGEAEAAQEAVTVPVARGRRKRG